MNTELPADHQNVEVKINGNEWWQPAVYRHGEFVDIYGLPLDNSRISDWKASDKQPPEPKPRHEGWTRP